ncbi:hypothetical protein P4O66_006371 [Electrophorus voltai]|uniref:Uncharacterized protein n=1 Tax=Electrophorus voltai TaxID=2609070 RepID=A0AAD8ZKK3_9TELE|nr:hypothetical protein P4O66_006371 [Electrophorus voltai]
MPAYMHISPQDSIHCARCKLHNLVRKCFIKVEKLKLYLEEHIYNGIPNSDLLEKMVSFFTVKEAFPTGYSRCTQDILQLVPSSTEDVKPLTWQQTLEINFLNYLNVT